MSLLRQTDASDPDDRAVAEIQRRLMRWGKKNHQDYPWRKTRDPFFGLVAEIMLQRTRAGSVVPVYYRFTERFPTVQHLVEADEREVEDIMRPLGLLWRVPLVKALGAHLYERGQLPSTLDELVELPGVGPYAAAAYLSFHGRGRGVLIDSNVVRWLARLTGRPYDAETRRKRWMRELADRITPHQNVRAFNYALLDFTMMICTPGTPQCPVCPLGPELCVFGRARLGRMGGGTLSGG